MKSGKAFILLTIFLFVLTGCGDDGTEVIRIGAVYPLSGPQGPAGEEVKQGIALAADIINNRYPQLNLPLAKSRGLPAFGNVLVQVMYADDQGTEAGVRRKTRELLSGFRVVALIGAYQSSLTKIASEMAEEAGVPFLTATSTDPALTERGFQWFFRTTPTDTTFADDAFRFMAELNDERQASLHRLAVIHEGSDFGTGFMDLVTTLAPQCGMEVVAEVDTQQEADSVSAAVDRIRAAQPEAVITPRR
ncbi:MAG: ABC transporter substrate-binding protein [Deltaproteobacteria bacterium]